jgi:hypothetical protein
MVTFPPEQVRAYETKHETGLIPEERQSKFKGRTHYGTSGFELRNIYGLVNSRKGPHSQECSKLKIIPV